MMKLNITIDMSNAAFGDTVEENGEEVERILDTVSDHVHEGGDGGTLFDLNGNTVGSWAIVTGTAD